MKVTIKSVHFTASDHLKEYIQKRCDKLEQFFDRITDARVVLKVLPESRDSNKYVEIQLKVPGEILIGSDSGSKFEEATDLSTDKLKVQLKRFKEKLKAH